MIYTIIAIWLVVFAVLVLAFRLYPRKPEIDHKAIAKDTIANELPEFTISHIFLRVGQGEDAKDSVHGIAIDNDSQRFCLISEGQPQPFEFKELIECELMVEGQSKGKDSRMVKFGGTPIGDQILALYNRFGEPKPEPVKFMGIVIKDPSKPKKSWFAEPPAKKNLNVDLRLIVDDAENPFRTFALMETDSPDGDAVEVGRKEGEVWFELLKKIIKAADESKADPDEKSMCIADEIEKLMDLKQKGILTDEEFASVKNRLVGAEA